MTSNRKGNWQQTYTNRKFYPLDPRPEDICIEDIAHGLSHVCRFAGHTTKFYSVAQHSVLVAQLCPAEDKLWGLLHDASEAYVGDMVRPLKLKMPEYRRVETGVMAAVKKRFGLADKEPPWVKLSDQILCCTEARDFMRAPDWAMHGPVAKLPERIRPWAPGRAEKEFLTAFKAYRLTKENIINPVFF
jgi:uncharacterized protein